MNKYLLCLSTIILFILYCSNEKTYTVEIVDNVRQVHNISPLWGNEPEIKLEHVRTFGEMESSDENYILFRPYGVAIDSKENIYILDSGNGRVQKYSPGGLYLATIGSPGQGPGELDNAMSICIDDNDLLYIGLPNAVSVLTQDGKELKRIRLPSWPQLFSLTPDNNILIPVKDYSAMTGKVQLVGQKGNHIRYIGNLTEYNDPSLTRNWNSCDFAVDAEGFIYISLNVQNCIEKYEKSGKLIQVISRKRNYELTYDDVTMHMEISGRKNTIKTKRFTRVSRRAGVDSKKRIWVHTYHKQKEEDEEYTDFMKLEVFDNSGVLLCEIPVPANGDLFIRGNRLFLYDYVTDMCVSEYKIIDLK